MCNLKSWLGATPMWRGQEHVTEHKAKAGALFQARTRRTHACAYVEQSNSKTTIHCVQMNKQKTKHSSFNTAESFADESNKHFQLGNIYSTRTRETVTFPPGL